MNDEEGDVDMMVGVNDSSPFDFKKEIEKRYKHSVVNKIFTFPRKISFDNEKNWLSMITDDSSLDSLKPILIYDLHL